MGSTKDSTNPTNLVDRLAYKHTQQESTQPFMRKVGYN